MTTITWTGTNGDWVLSPTFWSGGIVPTATDDVAIGLGGTVTISASEAAVANTLNLDASAFLTPGVTLAIAAGASLSVGGSVVLGAAVLDLAGILNGALTTPTSSGLPLFTVTTPGTLIADGGTLTGSLTVLTGEDLVVTGTANVNVAGPGGTAGQITVDGGLEFLGTPTLDNVTMTLHGGEVYLSQPLGPLDPGVTLTLGPNADLVTAGGLIGLGGGTLVNHGLIDITNAGTTDRYGNSFDMTLVRSFVNTGTVHAESGTRASIAVTDTLTNAATAAIAIDAGASLSLGGPAATFNNAGSITLGGGATLALAFTEDLTSGSPFANLGSVINSGGTVVLTGSLLNLGHTQMLSALTTQFGHAEVSGTIVGGTVVADDAGVPASGLTLDGATVDGDLGPLGAMTVVNAVTFHGLNGSGQGSIDLTAANGQLYVTGGTLDNVAIAIGNTVIASYIALIGTLGAGVTVTSTAPGASAAIITGNDAFPARKGDFLNLGVIDAAAPGGHFTIGADLTNDGTIVSENGDTVTFSSRWGDGTYKLATGGTFVFAGIPAGGEAVSFLDASASMLMFQGGQSVSSSPVIAGFQAGNTIDLQYGAGAPSASQYAASFAAGTIDITLSGSAYSEIPVAPGYDYSAATFAFQSDGGTGVLMSIACFLDGTRIATSRGEVPVETLRPGDQIRLAHGGTRPLLWLGHRSLDTGAHPRPDRVRPVRIRAGAFGPDQPRRDLWLSPEHAIFVDGVLIPAGLLINGISVVSDRRIARPSYWHVELDAHDVMMAEGLPVESFLDTGQRGAFANAASPGVAHPDFGAGRTALLWESLGAAPLVQSGPVLARVRASLAARLVEPEPADAAAD